MTLPFSTPQFVIPGLAVACLLAVLGASAAGYDPLEAKQGDGKTVDLTVRDEARDREIPLRAYLPDGHDPAPLVLFSHGLGGSRENNPYLGKHWSARGYVVVFMQHHGSDESVWKDQPLVGRMRALRGAASAKNFLLRVQDVPAVLDQLEKWNGEPGHGLAGRLDMAHIGMSGHSFGAVTTQSVSGQSAPLIGQRFTDKRIKAALAMSPTSPKRGDVAAAFGRVSIPWMVMTGTEDEALIGDQDVESRLKVYPNLPATIDRYELVFEGGQHSAFSERALPSYKHARNPNHHRAILALSTAFWDAYLRGDSEARKWLLGDGPRSVLEEKDRWSAQARQRK